MTPHTRIKPMLSNSDPNVGKSRKLGAAAAILTLSVFLAVLLGACNLSLLDVPGGFGQTPTPELAYPIPPTPAALPQAEVTFRVAIPADTPEGEPITLTLLDEVTGLALNPVPIVMQAEDATHYQATTLAAAGSVLKYRYTRDGSPAALEYTSGGLPVRYRMVHVEGPVFVDDRVSRWDDTLFAGPSGRIRGQVSASGSGNPLPDILVTAGGQQTITAADGTYLLEGLPEGKHTVVAYAMDGAYRTFQQEAIVAANATTPASLSLTQAPLVEVVFTVILPGDTIPGVPIRLTGNLEQLGNTFSDLAGGVSVLTSQMPVLSPLPDGRQTVTLTLPAGADLRYKYTLGDGFWNAEHASEGAFRVRQLIVPSSPVEVQDVVTTWRAGDSAPIWFDINIPADTPATDTIAIQFNPRGWTQSIPMWPLGNNRWAYMLTGPFETLGTIGYRYCRNEQCGIADDAMTPGEQSGGRPVSTNLLPQTLRDTVNRWASFEPLSGPVTVPGMEIPDRGEDFLAGIELSADFSPTWAPRLPTAMATIQGISANWVILTPSWSVSRLAPPVLNPVPGKNPLWQDTVDMIAEAGSKGLNVGIRPVPIFPGEADEWWASAPRDFPWWESWFERYSTFARHFATVGARENAPLLILGGEWLAPALPGGVLADGSPSGVPADAETRWRALLAEIRTLYGGDIAWALTYTDQLQTPPPFLDAVDQVYLLWQAPLADSADAPGSALVAEAARRLDTEVLPALAQLDLPVVVSIAYPSATGSITGCLPAPDEPCLPLEELMHPNPDQPQLTLDLDEQVEAYNAMLTVVSERSWIGGFIARDFFPPVSLRDTSTGIFGKPAADALGYWYPRLLGIIQ